MSLIIKANKKITYFQLFELNLIINGVSMLLKDINSVFSALGFLPDMINVLILILIVNKRSRKSVDHYFPVKLITLLLLFDIICLFFNQNFLTFVWGVRQEYRFFFFFIATIILFKNSDVEKIYDLLYTFLIANFIAVTIEFALGYSQDCLSGLFGVNKGSNGSANLFLSICLISIFIDYIYGKLENAKMIFYLAGIIIWAGLAELKYFFVLIAIFCVAMAIFVRQRQDKKVQIILLCAFGGIVGIYILEYVMPYYKDFFTLNNMFYYANHITTGVGGYSRTTVIPSANKYFFNYDVLKEFFGIGLGNAELSSIPMFTSEFYLQNNEFAYDTIYYSMIYVQRGWTGLIWYAVFFITPFIKSIKLRKYCAVEEKQLLDKAILVSIMTFLLAIYDDSMRRAFGGYLTFLVLATPYVIKKNRGVYNKVSK